MKDRLLLALGLVLVLALTAAACAGPSGTATPSSPTGGGQVFLPTTGEAARLAASGASVVYGSQQVGIWVNGEGAVSATPDLAILNLGIEAQAPTVAEAQRRQAEAMNGVRTALEANGVAEKDIRTTSFNIYPVTRWIERENRSEITGYTVSNMVQVKIRQVADAGKVIDSVAEAGGDLTRINGISFSVDDPTALFTQAREKALKNAMAKAEQMAEVTGVTLGKPVYITEGASYIPQARAFLEQSKAAGADLATPISGGELEVTVNVQITFAIE